MVKYNSLREKLTIAALSGILMLLLSVSVPAQSSPEINGTENCTCLCHQPSQQTNFTACAYSNLPDRATLVSPRDIVGTDNPAFVWNPAKDATRYCLKVANASQPNAPILMECYDASEVQSEWGCSVKPVLNLPPGSYRWWINTSNCKGEGGWSSYMEFTYQTGLNPGRPTAISPNGLISTKIPTFKWTPVLAATKYNLQVKTDNTKVVDVWFDAEKATKGDLCIVMSPVVLPDEVYFWRVQACIENKCGLWSEWQYFENICAFKPRPARINGRIVSR